MALNDWILEASEEAGQQEELRRQKNERLKELYIKLNKYIDTPVNQLWQTDTERECLKAGASLLYKLLRDNFK